MDESNQRVILKTPRLLLRPAYKQDAEGLFKAFSDPEVMKYWDTPAHQTLADTKTFVGKMVASSANGVTDFIIVRVADPHQTSPSTSVAGSSSGSTTTCSTPRSLSLENTGLGAWPEPTTAGSDEPNDRVIGKIGIWHTERSEIGFLLARNHWRQGLISEAMAILLPYYFEKRGVEKITADIDPDNVASRALLEKFGFSVVGRRENTFCVAGVWVDSLDLALTRDVYRRQMGGVARSA